MRHHDPVGRETNMTTGEVAGLGVAALGFGIAIWQIIEVRRQVKHAVKVSEATQEAIGTTERLNTLVELMRLIPRMQRLERDVKAARPAALGTVFDGSAPGQGNQCAYEVTAAFAPCRSVRSPECRAGQPVLSANAGARAAPGRGLDCARRTSLRRSGSDPGEEEADR